VRASYLTAAPFATGGTVESTFADRQQEVEETIAVERTSAWFRGSRIARLYSRILGPFEVNMIA